MTAAQGDLTGTVRLRVTDPEGRVGFVGFYVTDHAGVRSGPYPADRTPQPGVYEKDVVLGRDSATAVEPVAVLVDGEVVLVQPSRTEFGRRFGRNVFATASVGAFALAVAPGSITASAAPAQALVWKCWMRRGAWPTANNSPDGQLLAEFLRFEGTASEGSFSTRAAAGAWHAVAVAYNEGGEPGPRASRMEVAP